MQTPLSDERVITRSPTALATVLEGQAVILDINCGHFMHLNAVGSQVWWALETEQTLPKLCEAMTEVFDVSPELCRQDVTDFVVELQQQGLVTIR